MNKVAGHCYCPETMSADDENKSLHVSDRRLSYCGRHIVTANNIEK